MLSLVPVPIGRMRLARWKDVYISAEKASKLVYKLEERADFRAQQTPLNLNAEVSYFGLRRGSSVAMQAASRNCKLVVRVKGSRCGSFKAFSESRIESSSTFRQSIAASYEPVVIRQLLSGAEVSV